MNWEKWNKHYQALGIDPNRICRDGILNEVEWRKVDNKKILFVTKEVNDWEGGDLKGFLRDGPKTPMWHTVSRWAAGILFHFPKYEEIDTWSVMKEALEKVASINLKKTSGGGFSDMSIINAYAYTDRELLLEQIDEIQPNIIIACGTFDSVIWLLGLEINPDKPHEKPIFDKTRKMWVVPSRHPSRASNRKTYNELKEMIAEIA